jgi:hypothetical protein
MSPNLSDSQRSRMDAHPNASLTPKGREAMARSVIEGGLSKAVAARQFNTTPKTVYGGNPPDLQGGLIAFFGEPAGEIVAAAKGSGFQ